MYLMKKYFLGQRRGESVGGGGGGEEQPRSKGLSSNRPLGRARRDPGLVWSRVCQILAGYK